MVKPARIAVLTAVLATGCFGGIALGAYATGGSGSWGAPATPIMSASLTDEQPPDVAQSDISRGSAPETYVCRGCDHMLARQRQQADYYPPVPNLDDLDRKYAREAEREAAYQPVPYGEAPSSGAPGDTAAPPRLAQW